MSAFSPPERLGGDLGFGGPGAVMQREHAGHDVDVACPRRGVPPHDVDHVADHERALVRDAHLLRAPAGLVNGLSGRVNPQVRALGVSFEPLGQVTAAAAPEIQHVRRPVAVRAQASQRPVDEPPLDGVVAPATRRGNLIKVAASTGLGHVTVAGCMGHGTWGGTKRVTSADTVLPRWTTGAHVRVAIGWVAPKFNRLLKMDACNTAVACVLGCRLCDTLGPRGTVRLQTVWGLRSVVFMLLWIAHKVLDDEPVSNRDIPKAWDCMAPDAKSCRTVAQWNALEAALLAAMAWRTHVTPAQALPQSQVGA